MDTALNIRTCIAKAMRISRLPSSAQIMIDQKTTGACDGYGRVYGPVVRVYGMN